MVTPEPESTQPTASEDIIPQGNPWETKTEVNEGQWPPTTESSPKEGEAVMRVEETTKPKDVVLETILDRITPIGASRKKLKVLLYSEPGAGKTTILGQIPNSLIIDVEDGLMSLNNHPELLADNVRTMPYKSFTGLELLIKKFAENPPELSNIETLCIDSVSELHKRGLEEVTEREYERNPMGNRFVAETEHHTENNEHIRRLASSLRDLDRNMVITAHSRTVEPKNRPAKTFPDFSEKLANTLAGIVDVVAYMYVDEIEGEKHRFIRFHTNGTITAKTRIGGFPELMANPTWSMIWDKFQESQKNINK